MKRSCAYSADKKVGESKISSFYFVLSADKKVGEAKFHPFIPCLVPTKRWEK